MRYGLDFPECWEFACAFLLKEKKYSIDLTYLYFPTYLYYLIIQENWWTCLFFYYSTGSCKYHKGADKKHDRFKKRFYFLTK